MGLVKPLSTGGIPGKSESNDTLITPDDIATAVKDTFINRTAIAPQTYPEIYGSLLQYSEGVPTIVEYFKRRAPFINTQTIDTSFSLERASVHFTFDLIHNLEIRVIDQIHVETDQETTETRLGGTAFVYPGFIPNVGDIFYLKLPDNQIGVFVVNLTEPMSIYRGTNYRISFHLDSSLDDQTDTKLRGCVSDELYFDKKYYFSDEALLLKDTSYNQLTSLIKYRKSIIARLMNKFYDVDEKSIVRADSIYDPYLIAYLQRKISLTDGHRDLCQIPNPYVDLYDNTIWATFINQDMTNLIYTGYTLAKYQMFLFDVNMSNVDAFRLVTLIEQGKDLDSRLTQVKFKPTDATLKKVSYYFSDRLYYALLRSFSDGSVIPDIVPLLPDMADDDRIFENLSAQFYSVSDNAYHDIAFFDTHSQGTGSNNNVHLPELEYMVLDYILNDNIDTTYLIEKVLIKFPFTAMDQDDQLYTLAMLINLIDTAITRIR